MSDVKLLACPLCECDEVRDDVYIRDGRGVQCRACGCSVHAFNPDANQKAVALWNTRPAPALTPKQAAADEMAKALKRCAELVQAACDLITENHLQDREATWDGTTCDGQSYLDDAEAAMDNATSALAKAGRP